MSYKSDRNEYAWIIGSILFGIWMWKQLTKNEKEIVKRVY